MDFLNSCLDFSINARKFKICLMEELATGGLHELLDDLVAEVNAVL